METDLAARIVHGIPFTEKKSKFQAHLCGSLTCIDQVDVVMSILLQNRKVAAATHNIMAYRLQRPDGVWAQAGCLPLRSGPSHSLSRHTN